MTSRDRQIAVISVVAAVAGLASGWFIGSDNASTGDVIGFIIFSLLCGAVAALLFGRLIPRARSAPPGENRPAKTGIVTSVLGFLTIAVFWTGLPLVLGPAGAVLGWDGRQPAFTTRRGLATAALLIGALAFVLVVVVFVTDEISSD